MQIEIASFVMGGLLILVAVVGGGFEVKELRIPKVSNFSRSIAGILGLLFVGLAIWFHRVPVESGTSTSSTSTQVQQKVVSSDQDTIIPRKGSEPSVFDKLIGTWKGGPLLHREDGRRVFEIYTFKENGVIEEVLVDDAGADVDRPHWGQFAISNDELKIYWMSGIGGEETIRLTWIDLKTFRGRTIAHTDKDQESIDLMYRKLPNKPIETD